MNSIAYVFLAACAGAVLCMLTEIVSKRTQKKQKYHPYVGYPANLRSAVEPLMTLPNHSDMFNEISCIPSDLISMIFFVILALGAGYAGQNGTLPYELAAVIMGGCIVFQFYVNYILTQTTTRVTALCAVAITFHDSLAAVHNQLLRSSKRKRKVTKGARYKNFTGYISNRRNRSASGN